MIWRTVLYDMGTHMKTTIEISDDLLARARREGRRTKRTLRQIVEEALRDRLSQSPVRPAFTLEDGSVEGEGLQPDAHGRPWADIRDEIYRIDR